MFDQLRRFLLKSITTLKSNPSKFHVVKDVMSKHLRCPSVSKHQIELDKYA